MVFKYLCIIVLLTKVASALEGLRGIIKIHSNISQNIALFLEHLCVRQCVPSKCKWAMWFL